MKKTYIYALYCPLSNTIRYIGQTINKPSIRLASHLHEVKNPKYNTRKVNWISKLLRNDLTPIMIILDEVSKELADSIEMEWISLAKFCGLDLVNGTEGGYDVTKAIKVYHRRTEDKDVYLYEIATAKIYAFKGTKTAEEYLGCSKGSVSKSIHAKQKLFNHYCAYDIDSFDTYKSKPKHFQSIAVYNDAFYSEYDSVVGAMDDLGIARSCRSRVGYALSDGIQYKGFYFKRIDKEEAFLKLGELLETPEMDNQQPS